MSQNNKQRNKERIKCIINLDREKIKKTTEDNRKIVNILDDCQEFCNKYKNEDFDVYNIEELKEIYDKGKGLLDTYFIAEEIEKKDEKNIIIQLQYTITCVNNTCHVKELKILKDDTNELAKKVNETVNRAEKLEKDTKNSTKEIKHIKNDMKGILTTILALVLTFSIIPTAIAAINGMDPNYILPFISSILVFGMTMVMFIYSIYQDKLKISTWIIFIICICICIVLWVRTTNNVLIKKENKNSITNETYESNE